MVNLHDRIERMCYLGPEFIDITWGAGGSRPAATLEVVSNAQKVYGVETCMHLICTNNPTEKIDKALSVSEQNWTIPPTAISRSISPPQRKTKEKNVHQREAMCTQVKDEDQTKRTRTMDKK